MSAVFSGYSFSCEKYISNQFLTKRFIRAMLRKNKHKKRKKHPVKGNGFVVSVMKVDSKSNSPVIITSTLSRECCTDLNAV